MLDIVNLSEELLSKVRHETDLVMSDRLMTRDILDARMKELAQKRDEELSRVEQWASQQKTLISEIFSALLAETEADRSRNEANIAHMKGEATALAQAAAVVGKAPKAPRHLRAAE